MSYRCPHCGEEVQLLHDPQKNATVHCEKCGQDFSISGSLDTPPNAAKQGVSAEVMKDLAQQYFADLPDDVPQESAAQASESFGESETGWSPEYDLSEEDTRFQRELLFQYANEKAAEDSEEETLLQGEAAKTPKAKSFIREKRWQRGIYLVFLLCAVIIPLVRIILSRRTASTEQFNWMQPQIIPSLLYFLSALLLLYPLLRRTTKPGLIPALLLFIPLIADFWYLFPQITDALAPSILQSASSALKIVIATAALIMSKKPRKHPALPYKEVNSAYEQAE